MTGDLVVQSTDDHISLQNFLIEWQSLLPTNPAATVSDHECCGKLFLAEGKPFQLEWNRASDPDRGFKSFLQGPSGVPKLPNASPRRITVMTSGVNGNVYKVECTDNKRGLPVNVLLKESQAKSSDNLFIEWFNGRGINYLRKRIPIFPQTYELLATDYNNPPSYEPIVTPGVPLATLVQLLQDVDIAITTQFIDANHISLFDFMKKIKQQSLAGKMTPQTRQTHEHNILWALYFLFTCLYHLRKQLAHNDLHDSNIIFITPERPIQVIVTNASGALEQINLALFPVVIDFGRSMVIEPSHRIYTTDLYWIYRNIGQSEPHDERNGLYGCFNTFRSILFKKNTLGQLGSAEFKQSIAPLIAKYQQLDQMNETGDVYRLSDQLSSVASHVRQTTSTMDYPTDLSLIPDDIKDPHLLREPDYDDLQYGADVNVHVVQRAPPSSARPPSFFQLLNSGHKVSP